MLMKDAQKLIKLLEKVSGKKVKLVESYTSNLSNTLNTLISDARSNWKSRENLIERAKTILENNQDLYNWLVDNSQQFLRKLYHHPGDITTVRIAKEFQKALSKVSSFKESEESEENELPSAKQIGDIVDLDFGSAGKLTGCRIKDVHFAEDKVTYDIEIPLVIEGDDVKEATIIKDVDSIIINEEMSDDKSLEEN